MAIRMLRRHKSSSAVLSALIGGGGVSRRQAYRYLLQAQSSELLPVPGPKAVFTVNLPRRLIQQVRARCRQQRRPISHLVARVLQRWLEEPSPHG
jgi:hypothetical protein